MVKCAVVCTVFLILDSWSFQASAGSLKLLGSFKTPHAGFVEVVQDPHARDPKDQFTLFISSFNPIPLTSDYVYEVSRIGHHLGNVASIEPKIAARSLMWPNEVNPVPESVFNKNMVTVSGGFLVPLKTHGSIILLDYSTEPPKGPYHITDTSADAKWFYHRVQWKDMNGDGRMDAVTCRAEKPILLGGPKGQLVWYENPGGNSALHHTWKSHIIASGPDVYFDIVKLSTPSGTYECIVTAGFFSKSLNIYWTTDSKHLWSDASKIQHRVIDKDIKAVFDVKAIDIDKNGKLDLLVTSNDAHDASMYVYEVPSDFRTGTYKKHVIHSGFKSRTFGMGKGAPGTPLVFYPNTKQMSSKPWILLSGDDDGQAHLFKPKTESKGDFAYSMENFLDVGSGTVGKLAQQDVDGDGYTEVFVPSYSEGKVYVYTAKTN